MRKSAFLGVIAAGVFLILSSEVLSIDKQNQGPAYKPDEIIVKFKQGVSETLEKQLSKGESAGVLKVSTSLDELSRKHKVKGITPLIKGFKAERQRVSRLLKKDKANLTKREQHLLRRLERAPKGAKVPELNRIYRIELEEGQSAEDAVAEYKQNPDVEYAELNYIVHTATLPDDPYYNVQWALNNTGQPYPVNGGGSNSGTVDADINAPEAWDIYTGNSDVVVAVIDTGVDYTHRDLLGNLWTDPSGKFGFDFVNDDDDPMDDHGHGTHCAGIIASRANNGIDTAGACWNARIMAVKFLNTIGLGSQNDAINAIHYAVDNGADVLSNSWGGGDFSQSMQDAIDYAYSQGVIVVAAAGNNNSSAPSYPAYCDHVISVAATDSDDQKASFSNYGEWVDVAAPGVDILSLRGQNTDIYVGSSGYTPGGRFVPYGDPDATMYIASGTSMACPYISGACALMLSANPFLTSEDANDILAETADPIADGICSSDGRLNLFGALVGAIQSASKGHIALDSDYYNCDCNIGIFLTDCDISGEGTHAINIASASGDCETVILTEESPLIGAFKGTIHTAAGVPNIGDGNLQVINEDIVYATYYDANDGTGNPATATDTGVVDCIPPVISNIQMSVKGDKLTVTFNSDEPTAGTASCGYACGGPYNLEGRDFGLRTSHAVELSPLLPHTTYYFAVAATDAAGNQTADSNSGNCYWFITTAPCEMYVPSQYPTIQDAIDYSWPESVVWVADGVYTGAGNRDIDFQGKAITVKSENGPENCIIDCQGNVDDPHRGFYFKNYEDINSVVEGFTITNGFGPADYWDGHYFRKAGGGISCYNSSPTIKNCTIIGNRTSYSPGQADGVGAGICCDNSNLIISNSKIIDNTSGYGNGGGIFGHNTNVSITNCKIYGNNGGSGGGIYINGGNPIIQRCFISNNDCSGRGSLYFEFYCDAKVINCIISKNTSSDVKAGIYCENQCDIIVTNCTIADNSQAAWGGGIYCDYESTAIVTNCISWGNSLTDLPPTYEREICARNDSNVAVAYSDVAGGISGAGNISADPMFLGTNPILPPADYYYLGYMGLGSPCIDAGTNSPPGGLPSTDIDGRTRPVDTADMGAYEFEVFPPIIWRWPGEFKFYAVEGESNPDDQILSIRKIGLGPMSWEITEGCSWLEVIPTSGELATGEVDEVNLSVDASGLGLGTYCCVLIITSAEAINSPEIVVVELSVERPKIELSADEFRFLATADGPNPPDQILTIRNSGIGTLNWTIDYDCNWLQVDPNTGSSTVEANEVVLSADCTGLEASIYNCELTVSDPCATNSPQTVEVILHIGPLELLVPSEYPTIQTAIYYAEDGDTVIVADGIYTGTGNRLINFMGKAITVRSENGPENCVIDAEHLGQVFQFYNNEDADSIVDGFTITHGQIYCEPGKPCPISWYGGGIYCDASPTIRNCIITDNLADFGGGAYCKGSPTIINCILTSNAAIYGAAILADDNTKIINCTITRNWAEESAVLSLDDSVIVNSIVWDNYPAQLTDYTSGGGIIIYNDIQDGWPGEGNIDADPCFADANNGDYHLKSIAGRWNPDTKSWVTDANTSPCIDAGNPGCPLGDEPSDANNVRINMGAYGGTVEASKTPVGWRSIADLTNDWVIDINDLEVFVNYWLDSGECIPGDLDRNQLVNFVDYAIFAQQWLYTPSEPGIEFQISPCEMWMGAGSSGREPGQSDETRFTVTVEGRNIHFEDTMVANCCATELWLEMEVNGNTITIYEHWYAEYPCTCICDNPVTATLGSFEPGTYTLEVYEDFGGFIGSTTVIIE
ncbi:MAG: S8 family serine peptidase [Sedimentisphaerales bacterium]|nr:S8 family serine peptidase [Sedimentisphaerales bacterium]